MLHEQSTHEYGCRTQHREVCSILLVASDCKVIGEPEQDIVVEGSDEGKFTQHHDLFRITNNLSHVPELVFHILPNCGELRLLLLDGILIHISIEQPKGEEQESCEDQHIDCPVCLRNIQEDKPQQKSKQIPQ